MNRRLIVALICCFLAAWGSPCSQDADRTVTVSLGNVATLRVKGRSIDSKSDFGWPGNAKTSWLTNGRVDCTMILSAVSVFDGIRMPLNRVDGVYVSNPRIGYALIAKKADGVSTISLSGIEALLSSSQSLMYGTHFESADMEVVLGEAKLTVSVVTMGDSRGASKRRQVCVAELSKILKTWKWKE